MRADAARTLPVERDRSDLMLKATLRYAVDGLKVTGPPRGTAGCAAAGTTPLTKPLTSTHT